MPVRRLCVCAAMVLVSSGGALGQSLVGATVPVSGQSDLLLIDPVSGATQFYMSVTIPSGRELYFLAALPDCRLAGSAFINVGTPPNFASKLVQIDTFTGVSTTIDFGAPLSTSYAEGMDYSPRHGALLMSFTTLNSFGSNRLAVVNPATGAVTATSSVLSAPDLDTIISGPSSDIFFDLNGTTSPRVRQLSALFPTPALSSFATPPVAANWYDGAMHPGTGEVIFTFPVTGTSTGSRLARLVGNAYVNGAVVTGTGTGVVTIRGLAWANLPARFPAPVADVRVCPGGNTALVSTAVGTSFTQRWEIADAGAAGGFRALADGVLLVDGTPVAAISGTATGTLSIDLAGYGAALGGVGVANFRCVAENACGTTPSAPAAVRVCAGDFNCDGNVDADDLGDFITCFFATPPCSGAEFNADGDVNADDLGDFITLFFAGGC